MSNPLRPTALATLLSFSLLAGCAAPAGGPESDSVESTEDSLRQYTAAERLGTIAYGETKTVDHPASPTYRSYAFDAKAGDEIEVRVSAERSDAVLWLVAPSSATLKKVDAFHDTREEVGTYKIPSTGRYSIAFREADYEPARFTVKLAKTNGPVVPPVVPPPVASNDPFDAASCTGPLLTDPAARFAPGAAKASLGRYTLMYRERTCTEVTGCGAWSVPVAAGTVIQTGIYALVSWGYASDQGRVKGAGRAELAVSGSAVALDLIDDGATYPENSQIRHTFSNGVIAGGRKYGTTRYYGNEGAGGTTDLTTAGGTRDGVWMKDYQPFTLRGELRASCARLVATPDMKIYRDAYREVEVGALLRY